MKEATLPDDVLWSRLADVQNTALLLFANYVDAATQMSESCGGGGSSAMESGWEEKKTRTIWHGLAAALNKPSVCTSVVHGESTDKPIQLWEQTTGNNLVLTLKPSMPR